MCRLRSRKRSLVYFSLIYQHNPVCCQQVDTLASRNNCIPAQKNHNVARISGSRLHSRPHLGKEWKQKDCFSHTISQGDLKLGFFSKGWKSLLLILFLYRYISGFLDKQQRQQEQLSVELALSGTIALCKYMLSEIQIWGSKIEGINWYSLTERPFYWQL